MKSLKLQSHYLDYLIKNNSTKSENVPADEDEISEIYQKSRKLFSEEFCKLIDTCYSKGILNIIFLVLIKD